MATATYYHYTTPEAAQLILNSGVIFKSTKKRRRGDVRYGEGVYLTQVPPSTPKFHIAFNNYDGSRNRINLLQRVVDSGKLDAYVKLELNVDDIEECEDERGRDIYLYPDSDLHIVPSMKAELGLVDHHQ